MLKNLAKLIDVKSLVTLVLTAVFAALALGGEISAEQFQTVFTTVIAFYFGTQYQKNVKEDK
ncbi:MAG: hypothetical protein IJX77_06120 [Ruminococcus sp.]|nr:hypothetical protein [Ruminococcus sp.]MBQ8297340.1 hypothetical protein [Ruminococcus sp.]